jgi:hypothetical protein
MRDVFDRDPCARQQRDETVPQFSWCPFRRLRACSRMTSAAVALAVISSTVSAPTIADATAGRESSPPASVAQVEGALSDFPLASVETDPLPRADVAATPVHRQGRQGSRGDSGGPHLPGHDSVEILQSLLRPPQQFCRPACSTWTTALYTRRRTPMVRTLGQLQALGVGDCLARAEVIRRQ